MKVEELLELLINVAEGEDRIYLGVVSFNGYGFIFQDPFISAVPYITAQESSKFCSISLLLKRNIFQQDFDKYNLKGTYEYMTERDNYDMLLAGALKTLVPTLKFGGEELLFDTWVFVKTPDGKQFPATYYYAQSGMSLGGWSSYNNSEIFPKKFISIINFTPFDFGKEELEELVQALEHALRKVPVSDFHGIYKHDFGQTLMGVRDGRPFTMELYRPMTESEVKKLIHHRIL